MRVAVIGGGVVGAMIAYELSRHDQTQELRRGEAWTVSLWDEGPSPLGGADRPLAASRPKTTPDDQGPIPRSRASAAALGVLMAVISQKTKGRSWHLRETSLRRYPALIAELADLTGQTVPYNDRGILKRIDDPADRPTWERLATVRRSQGWPLAILEPEDVADCYPQLEPPRTGDRPWFAVYSAQDGQVDPVGLHRALVAGAVQRGVACHWQTTIEAVRPGSIGAAPTWEIVTAGQTIVCDRLVLAAGLGSPALAGSLAIDLPIQPVLGQAARLRLAEPLGSIEPVLTANDIHVVPLGRSASAVPTAPADSIKPNRATNSPAAGYDYWIGATVEFPPEMAIASPTKTPDPAWPDPDRWRDVWAGAIAMCPGLAPAQIIETWSGLRPRPVGRSAPVIQALADQPGVWLATGHYRNGILLAPATAAAIVTAIQA